MYVDFDWFNPEHFLIGFQYMDYEAVNPLNEEIVQEGKSISLGLLFVTITLYF